METKVCTKCKRELPIENFHWRDKAKGTRRSECKDCHNQHMRNSYNEKKKSVQELKIGLKCAKCGDNRSYVLDFHHIDPSIKKEDVSQMLINHRSLEDIQKEIEKCIVLCSNCHREFHYLNYNNGINLDDYLK